VSNPFDIMCVGDLCVDLIMSGNVRPRFGQVEQIVDSYDIQMGGSASIFACGFAKLGGKVAVLGKVGQDAFGSFIVDTLKQAGVDTGGIETTDAVKTGCGVTLAEPDDRAILTYLGSIDAVTPAEVEKLKPERFKHWHLANYFLLGKLRSLWPTWLPRLREAGVTVSLDTNWDPSGTWTDVMALLPHVDVFLPNAEEARALTGQSNIMAAGAALAKKAKLVVIKRGPDGAAAFSGSDTWQVRGSAVRGIKDTVGAGDSFDVGFLRGWLLQKDMDTCLALGDRCGRANLRGVGGVQGQLREKIK